MPLKSVMALAVAGFASAFPLPTQGQTAASPVAQTLQSSLSAMLGKTSTLTDATLSGTVDSVAGSNKENGNFTFRGTVTGGSRLDLNLTSGTRSEIRSILNGAPVGAWSGADGIQHASAPHNLLTGVGWPFPAIELSTLLQDSTMVVNYVGLEGNLIHFEIYHLPPGTSPAAAAWRQRMTKVELWLSSSTLLPARMSFMLHPDKNAAVDLPIRVEFSNYISQGGILFPGHVQKFLNGTLMLDLQVQSAAINTGIPASDFGVQN